MVTQPPAPPPGGGPGGGIATRVAKLCGSGGKAASVTLK